MPSQNQGYREQNVKTSNPLNAQENPSQDNVIIQDKASNCKDGKSYQNQSARKTCETNTIMDQF